MATPPRTLALSMDAFPDCPDAFRRTLETLLTRLNEQSQALNAALSKGLTREENMRGGLVSASGTSGAGAPFAVVFQFRNPLPVSPRAVWPVRFGREDGAPPGYWNVSRWRTLQSGLIEAEFAVSAALTRYVVTLAVE